MCNFNVYNFIIATVSIFAAVVVAVLFFFGFIANFTPVITILAIIAAVLLLLIIILLLVPCFNSKTLNKCLCKFGNAIILGSIGTIIAAIIAVAIGLVAETFLSAVVVFFLILFFVIAVLGFVLLLYCILCSKCARYQNNRCNINDEETIPERKNDCGCRFMD